MRRILLAIVLAFAAIPASAQSWDRVNGSMQVKSGPAAPLVIIDQTNTAANRKILSLRAAGTEKCSIDIDGDLVCAGTFTLTGQFLGTGGNCTTAPAYSFTGDTNNGWSSSSADTQCWAINGVEVLALGGGELHTFGYVFRGSRSALSTTSTTGAYIDNLTAATVGTPVQISPRWLSLGGGWDVDDAVNRNVQFFTETLPVSGNTVTGTYKIGYIDPVSAAITYPFTVGSSGIATGGAYETNSGSSYYSLATAFASRTAPTIASGGCTSPAITWSNGTAAFLITIGTSCTGVKTVTLTMPAAANAWACDGDNHTSDAAQQTNYIVARSTSTTAVVVTSYDRVTGLQEDFTASNTYLMKCSGG